MLNLFRPRLLLFALLLAGVAITAMTIGPQSSKASAHPLGNFTINRYTRIDISATGIDIRYVLDMAEIPAFQERPAVDANGDGAVSPVEETAYLEAKVNEIGQGIHLTIDGTPVALQKIASTLSFPAGQGGLTTQRLVADFTVVMPSRWEQSSPSLEYEDRNYSERLGWREVVVRSLAGVRTVSSSAPHEDLSDELRSYPSDGISNPLDLTSATVQIEPAAVSPVASSVRPVQPVVADADEAIAVRGNPDSSLSRFAGLIAEDRLSVGVVVVAALAAFAFGAIHALSPGHGKTIVAAYLIGSRGTARHALLLALTVTVTHTSSVYVLGFVTLYLSNYILPEQLYPWLGIASGGLILAMGLSLFVGRLKSSGLLTAGLRWGRDRLAAFGTSSGPSPVLVGAVSSHPVVLADSVPSAVHHEPVVGTHRHDSQDHAGEHSHEHSLGAAHGHVIPGQDGRPVTWRGLVGLGIFGGMLPCPTAIVVMLSAIALHRVVFGLGLIVAFSFGLAVVLTLIGFAMVYTSKLSERLPLLRRIANSGGRAGGLMSLAVRVLPTASAAAVVAVGLVVMMRAFAQQGTL